MEKLVIRNARRDEFDSIGKLLVRVYSSLDGFPTPEEQPQYYDLLANVGKLADNPAIEIIAAFRPEDQLAGAVVFFHDMTFYESGVGANLKDASGFRLLCVDPKAWGNGVGKALTLECIRRARANGSDELIIHTTKAMQRAWGMYEKIGFTRAPDLDFMQGELGVFGFRIRLT